MPPSNRKKKFAVKLELSPKGLVGTTIVCLCIFLWMFLLGVWAGQTILNTRPGTGSVVKKSIIKKRAVAQPDVTPTPVKQAVTVKRKSVKKSTAPERTKEARSEPEEDPSFFSVQLAAFKDKELAGKAVQNWKAKGYKAFLRPPEGENDPFTRVYIGKFDVMEEAREYAEKLKQKENQKSFIALVPGYK